LFYNSDVYSILEELRSQKIIVCLKTDCSPDFRQGWGQNLTRENFEFLETEKRDIRPQPFQASNFRIASPTPH